MMIPLKTRILKRALSLQAYEALEERVREADASTSSQAEAGPKVIERQWLQVHVDLSLADSLDENPLVRCVGGFFTVLELTSCFHRNHSKHCLKRSTARVPSTDRLILVPDP